jgi:mycothiol system anti-sigma-R factor
MPDCNETLREMYLFLDGELPAEVRLEVRTHLDTCNDCLGVFSFHVELKEVIVEKASREPLPPGLLDRIKRCFGD